MFLIFFLAGMIVSGNLAYAGLVRNQLSVSKSKVVQGAPAKVVGLLCLAVFVSLLGGVAWTVWMMATKHT